MLTVSALFTAVAALRYFTNDRGEMVIERGIEKVEGRPRQEARDPGAGGGRRHATCS